MKNLALSQIIRAFGLLSIGLFLGWMLFSGSSEHQDHSSHGHQTLAEEWTCSMHPQIREDGPGKCPLCSMDLIPVSTNQSSLSIDEIQMSKSAMMLASIQTSKVELSRPNRFVSLQGRVTSDERRMATVTAHFDGRVEKLETDFTGQLIRKGQRLATIYSPDLVTAQKELFEAMKFKTSNPSFYSAAIQKLKLWELTDSQIRGIIDSGEPQYYFNIYAPKSGTITDLMLSEGDHVTNGQAIFKIADLTRLWVAFDVYENDLSWVNIGDSIKFNIQSLPSKDFNSVITFIDPVIDPATRTVVVRTEVVNRDGLLKPEMFAEGMVKAGSNAGEPSLLIPKTAVLWTGKRSVVYVRQSAYDEPTFQFREVDLGPLVGEQYIVIAGVAEGEEVASHGVFKIDAAAQLQGKVSMMNPDKGEEAREGHHLDMGGDQKEVNVSDQLFDVSDSFQEQIKNIYDRYLPVKDALIDTNLELSKKQAQPLLAAINSVDMTLIGGDAHLEWMDDLAVLKSSVELILRHSDVEKVREQLSPLSDQLYQTITKFQVETGGYRQYCPMAFDFQGAFWLSDSDEVLNPYFGDQMLTCGSVEETLK